MNKKVGIWIDHNRAFIISIENDNETIEKIESNVEAHIRSLGGAGTSTPYGPQEFSVERKVEARRKKHLRPSNLIQFYLTKHSRVTCALIKTSDRPKPSICGYSYLRYYLLLR